MLLVGFGKDDDTRVLQPVADKIATMRIFSDERGRFDASVLDTNGAILAVPQFTLYADTAKGRRPEFFQALAPEPATQLFTEFKAALRRAGVSQVESGVFGANMEVELVNDGPVTISLERLNSEV
jgi:D-tyrosyl-tRNA(Tyr) deacylase